MPPKAALRSFCTPSEGNMPRTYCQGLFLDFSQALSLCHLRLDARLLAWPTDQHTVQADCARHTTFVLAPNSTQTKVVQHNCSTTLICQRYKVINILALIACHLIIRGYYVASWVRKAHVWAVQVPRYMHQVHSVCLLQAILVKITCKLNLIPCMALCQKKNTTAVSADRRTVMPDKNQVWRQCSGFTWTASN